MRTCDELAEKLMNKLYPDVEESARYAKLQECRQRVINAHPVVRLGRDAVEVTTPDARYRDALKPLGFKWCGGYWEKRVTNTEHALNTLRALDGAVADLVIAPGQEKVLERL